MSPIPLPEAASFPFATPHALLGLSEVLGDVRLSAYPLWLLARHVS